MIRGVLAVLVATIAVHFESPARADNACIVQPSQPAAEGTRWSLHYDRAKGRKCWVLVDAAKNGHDAATQAQSNAAPTPGPVEAFSSQIASLLGNFTGGSANVTPQATAPQVNAAQTSPAGAPRKPQVNAANAGKADNGVRADPRSEGPAMKRAASGLTEREREALFEEFLRWQNQENLGTLIPLPSSP
jgi:hypothetical protein